MKQFTYLRIALTLLITSSLFSVNAQFQSLSVKIQDDLKYNPGNFNRRSATNPKSCNGDTLLYVRQKASAYNSLAVATGSAIGQYYSAPKSGVTIKGLTFYSWSIDSATVKVVYSLYKAGIDSLPSGNPVLQDTVTIDSTFGSGLLSILEKKVSFKDSAIVNYPYIVTIGVAEPNKRAGCVGNSWANRDGDRENLLCGSVSGTWYNGLNLNVGGTRLDADMQIYPHVKYKLAANFSTKDSCYDYRDTMRFNNITHDSSVTSIKYYNRYAYYKERYNNNIYMDICYRWNYGDNNSTYQKVIATKKYSSPENYTVRLIATNYPWVGSSCIDTHYVQLSYQPLAPTVRVPSPICDGDSANMVAYAAGTNNSYEWFKKPLDTIPYHKGDFSNTGSKVIFDTVYVRTINQTCISGRSITPFEVSKHPDDPSVSHDSICLKSRANLSAKSNIGEIFWFSSKTSSNPFHIGEVFQTLILSGDVTYYVQAFNRGCFSDNRIPITAYVRQSFAPTAPTVLKDTTLCLRGNNSINLSASVLTSDTVRWFDIPSGGTPFKKGKTHSYTSNAIGTKYFYVDAWNGNCASSREPIRINTQDYPDFISINNDTICKGEDAQISAMIDLGEVKWYKDASLGNELHVGRVLQFPKRDSNLILFAESREGICINPKREKVVIQVNDYAPITNKNAEQICSESWANLSADIASGVLNWYENIDDKTPIHTGKAFTTPKLFYSKDYYLESVKDGCISPRETITASVLQRPVAGFEYNVLWPKKVSLKSVIQTGVNYAWDLGDGFTSKRADIEHTYDEYGTYKIQQVLTSRANGCKDTSIVELFVDFTDLNDLPQVESKLFPNPTNGDFIVELSNPLNRLWSVKITDITGRVVSSRSIRSIAGTLHMNVDAKGIFFIHGTSGTEQFNAKVIVQ